MSHLPMFGRPGEDDLRPGQLAAVHRGGQHCSNGAGDGLHGGLVGNQPVGVDGVAVAGPSTAMVWMA